MQSCTHRDCPPGYVALSSAYPVTGLRLIAPRVAYTLESIPHEFHFIELIVVENAPTTFLSQNQGKVEFTLK